MTERRATRTGESQDEDEAERPGGRCKLRIVGMD